MWQNYPKNMQNVGNNNAIQSEVLKRIFANLIRIKKVCLHIGYVIFYIVRKCHAET